MAILEALGHEFRHSIVAMDGRTDAYARFSGRCDVRLLEAPPRAGSLATLRRLRALLQRERPTALLTYNWGAFDAVFAARSLGMRRVLHHEDGFTSDEATGFKSRRVWARRLMLPRVHRVIVPSRNLERIACATWKLAPSKVAYVANGVRLERFEPRDGRAKLRAELGIPRDALVIGYVGHLRPEKNPLRFLQACARVDPELGARFLVLGDGSERQACETLVAKTSSLFGKTVFAGHVVDPREHYRAMDVFCVSSDTEQMPVALLEAMASALPVVSTDVGDVRAMLPAEQGEFVVELDDRGSAWPLAEKLAEMARDPSRRAALGRANRARVEAEFSFDTMLARYRDLYQSTCRA